MAKEIVVSLIVFCLNRNKKIYIACKKAFWNMLVKWNIIRVNLRFLNLVVQSASIITVGISPSREQKMINKHIVESLFKILTDHGIIILLFFHFNLTRRYSIFFISIHISNLFGNYNEKFILGKIITPKNNLFYHGKWNI